MYIDCKALWYMLSASNFVYQLKTKFPQFLPQLSHWLTAWPEASHWSSLGVSWLPVKQDNGAAPAGSCKHRVMVCEALWFTHKRGCKKANHRSALQASANYFWNKKRWIFYPSRRYRRSLMVSRWGGNGWCRCWVGSGDATLRARQNWGSHGASKPLTIREFFLSNHPLEASPRGL